jgi:hypothetical protein
MAGGTWIPMYLEPPDLAGLIADLDGDPEIAWIVPDGGRWVARRRLDRPAPPRICLWHAPSGPLPMLVPVASTQRPGGFGAVEERGVIKDPFAGWNDPFAGELDEPRFGSPPGVIWLNLRVRGGPGGRPDQATIEISSFEWIGRRYAVLGTAPTLSTTRWWRALRRSLATRAVRVPYAGRWDGPRPEVFAFPAALAAIKAGAPRGATPAVNSC